MSNESKKVTLTLVGLNGNAFSLMGAFSHAAREQGWTKEEIDVVMKDCMSGDYDHLLQVLMGVCEDDPDYPPEYDEDDDGDIWDDAAMEDYEDLKDEE